MIVHCKFGNTRVALEIVGIPVIDILTMALTDLRDKINAQPSNVRDGETRMVATCARANAVFLHDIDARHSNVG